MQSINCKGIIIKLDKPIVMGIINATPDSFYKGDLNLGLANIVSLATKMLAEGATILDIGGQSTKPTAIISVDTFKSAVAQAAVHAGASMVNDVSCGEMDTDMIPTVASMNNVPYIGMHMRGTPSTMQGLTNYENVVEEIKTYFAKQKTICNQAGIQDFIIDPGFGFAKTIPQNFSLLKNLASFKTLDCPMLIGVSRKSSIYKTLGITAVEALNGATVLHTLAAQNGTSILRVHDVKEAVEVVKLMEVYNNA
jgi:dihydropteroate synthase